MSLRFRLCQKDDIPRLVEFVNQAYRGETSKAGWTTEEALLGGQRTDADMIQSYLDSPQHQVWLAWSEDGTELEGSFVLEQDGHRSFLGMLTVSPRLQGQGKGRELLHHAENLTKIRGQRSLFMTVISARSELISYYHRRGYLPTGEQKTFPMDDPRFGLPKRRDFHLAVLEKKL